MTPRPVFTFQRIPGLPLKAVLLFPVAAVLVVLFSLRKLARRALLGLRVRRARKGLDAWLDSVRAEDEERRQR